MEGSVPDTLAPMLHVDGSLLLLGGDLGDVRCTFDQALSALGLQAGIILAESREHWTEPWGFKSEGSFLNKAILLRTELPPEELLGIIQDIEQSLGRVRAKEQRYASRTLDIDILLHGGQVIGLPHLVVPHPRMHLRSFALAPAADIAPMAGHPLLNRTILDLLNELRPSS